MHHSDPDHAKVFKHIKGEPGMSRFLSHDSRRVATLRARLRLDRSTLSESQCRRGMTTDPMCPWCPHQEETLEHALLECKYYNSIRAIAHQGFQHAAVSLSVRSLLGEIPTINNLGLPVSKDMLVYLLSVGEIFLLEVDKLRNL